MGGYQEFALRHRVRRKMVLVGSNDGQLHVFDAGRYSATVDDLTRSDPDYFNCFDDAGDRVQPVPVIADERFDNGTGHELFSFVPRACMDDLPKLPGSTPHRYSVDSSVAVGDVDIGPVETVARPAGRTSSAAGAPWWSAGFAGAAAATTPSTSPSRTGSRRRASAPSTASSAPPRRRTGRRRLRAPLPRRPGDRRPDDRRLRPPRLPDRALGARGHLGREPGRRARPGRHLVDPGARPDPGLRRLRLGLRPFRPRTTASRIAGSPSSAAASTRRPPFSGPGAGSFLYMVDVATGETIYKEELDGMAPSDPAVVDTDQDGYLDRIYIGTTAGPLYKVNLRSIPRLRDVQVSPGPGQPHGDRPPHQHRRRRRPGVASVRDLRHRRAADLLPAVGDLRRGAGPVRDRLRHRRPGRPVVGRPADRALLRLPRQGAGARRREPAATPRISDRSASTT